MEINDKRCRGGSPLPNTHPAIEQRIERSMGSSDEKFGREVLCSARERPDPPGSLLNCCRWWEGTSRGMHGNPRSRYAQKRCLPSMKRICRSAGPSSTAEETSTSCPDAKNSRAARNRRRESCRLSPPRGLAPYFPT